MISQPGLRKFVIVPLIANIVLFSFLGWALYKMLFGFYLATMLMLPEWLQFLSWLFTPLIWLIGGLIAGYTSTFLVLILTSPFNTLLSEKVEESITGAAIADLDNTRAVFFEIPRALFREIRKLLYYLPMVLGVLLLTLIPILNSLAPFVWFLLGAWMMSLQFIDYPMDNHRLPFREVQEACAARRLSTLGFGGTVALFAGIPLLNLVVIPAAVIGATILWCEEFRSSR